MTLHAPAKVNLVLRLGPRRDDGYHELATLLCALDVGDELTLEPAAGTFVEAPGLPGGDTLVTAALGLLATAAGHDGGWRVGIDKRIPAGAGLGGGSSDAGVALAAANATLARPLPAGALLELAAGVGSDVPFFASGAAAAQGRGRGELIEPVRLAARFALALAWPGQRVPTADVYARVRPPQTLDAPAAAAAALAADLPALAALVANDLQDAAEAVCPASAALRRALLERGAAAAAVSGSGSAVFGLFADRSAAERACAGLPGAAWAAAAEPIA